MLLIAAGLGLQGWRWLEDEWFIDMGGLGMAAVDEHGWSYAVDFSWLHHPPLAGSGRFKRVNPVILCCVVSGPVLHSSMLLLHSIQAQVCV